MTTKTESKNIGRWIKQLLKSQYSGQQLAAVLGCGCPVISRINTGQKVVTPEWVDEHKTGLLTVAMLTGNTTMRNLLYSLEDSKIEQSIDKQIQTGGLVVPVRRERIVNSAKRKGAARI